MKTVRMMLANSPFTDFLIPGILLFAVIGLTRAALGTVVLFRFRLFPANIIMWLLGER